MLWKCELVRVISEVYRNHNQNSSTKREDSDIETPFRLIIFDCFFLFSAL